MKVAIVDDEKDCCDDLAGFVRLIGHDVLTFTDPRAALAALGREKTDVIITDVNMPFLTGPALFRELRSRGNTSAVFFISGKGETIDALNAMGEGVVDFFVKPVDVKKVAEALARITVATAENGGITAHRINEACMRDGTIALADVVFSPADFPGIRYGDDIGIFSAEMKAINRKLSKMREYPELPVLIEGETGTGKEWAAQFIHHGETGAAGPFVALNCATIGRDLFEAELFGYEGGAFTGADPKGRDGKIDAASGGTLFLDEVTETDSGSQSKLLRVLESGEYYRVGSALSRKANARIVCATNIAVDELAAKGAFRSDLYYRLSVCKVVMPALRERMDDIAPLAVLFFTRLNRAFKKNILRVETRALRRLRELPWRGNVRELKNVITAVMAFAEGDVITEADIVQAAPRMNEVNAVSAVGTNTVPDAPFDLQKHIKRLAKEEARRILDAVLIKCSGNKSKAAEYCRLTRVQFYRLYGGK
ncbi:MAG: sigma-54 dependent transcriptional regulator [Spirochaetota bacterium]